MTKQLVVKAPLVIAKTSTVPRRDLYLYRGATVTGQTKDWVERHLRDGLVEHREVEERQLPTGGPGESSPPSSSTGDGFDAEAFLGRNADEVIADVATLSTEDRATAASTEAAGKNRSTVLAALQGD